VRLGQDRQAPPFPGAGESLVRGKFRQGKSSQDRGTVVPLSMNAPKRLKTRKRKRSKELAGQRKDNRGPACV